MNKSTNALLTLAFMCLFSVVLTTSAFATELRTLSVSGRGEVTLAPDVATFNITVSTDDLEASAALETNNQIMANVHTALFDQGVTTDDVMTTSFSVQENLTWDRENERFNQNGFTAQHVIQVTTFEVDQVGTLITAASNAGATSIGRVTFSITDSNAPYNEALALASQSARSKADVIATSLGTRVIGVLSAEEDFGRFMPSFTTSIDTADSMSIGSIAAESSPVAVQSGDLSVIANLNIVFIIE